MRISDVPPADWDDGLAFPMLSTGFARAPLTVLNGPTALFWHAMRLAHTRRIPRFDFGAVAPTEDPAHPHHSVYHFKRGFGGRIEEMRGAEVLLSPLKCRFQDRVVLPAWKRMYPWYLSLVGRHAVSEA